jgi:hypothetical protein
MPLHARAAVVGREGAALATPMTGRTSYDTPRNPIRVIVVYKSFSSVGRSTEILKLLRNLHRYSYYHYYLQHHKVADHCYITIAVDSTESPLTNQAYHTGPADLLRTSGSEVYFQSCLHPPSTCMMCAHHEEVLLGDARPKAYVGSDLSLISAIDRTVVLT